jgi:hypothetical protein
MLAPRVVVCQPLSRLRQASGVAPSMTLMGGLVGVWSRAEPGNKINVFEMIPYALLAFRCYALYMYHVGENLLDAETGHAQCG